MIEVLIGETACISMIQVPLPILSRASGWTMETGGNRFRAHPYLEPVCRIGGTLWIGPNVWKIAASKDLMQRIFEWQTTVIISTSEKIYQL
jgi:hypothetical protein